MRFKGVTSGEQLSYPHAMSLVPYKILDILMCYIGLTKVITVLQTRRYQEEQAIRNVLCFSQKFRLQRLPNCKFSGAKLDKLCQKRMLSANLTILCQPTIDGRATGNSRFETVKFPLTWTEIPVSYVVVIQAGSYSSIPLTSIFTGDCNNPYIFHI